MGLELLGRTAPPDAHTTAPAPRPRPPWQPLHADAYGLAAPPSATPTSSSRGIPLRPGASLRHHRARPSCRQRHDQHLPLRAGRPITIPAGGGTAAGSPLVHSVQPGETLSSIAQAYNTTVWAIMSANGLTSHTIYAYRALFIPVAPAGGLTAHIVMPGETLYTIAQRYHTTVALLMMANNLTDYAIYVHQPLIIPPAGWSGWPPLAPGSHSRTHLVVPGDTLFGIARQYGVTVGALMSANGLSSSAIYASDTLRIP